MRLVALLLVASLAATSTGCSHADTDDPGGTGSHTVAFDGESVLAAPWRETVTGRALFAPTTFVPIDGAPIPRLSLQFQDARTERYVLLTLDTFDPAIPAPGTYPVTSEEQGVAGAFYVWLSHVQTSPSYTDAFAAESGTVTITSASDARIEGRLDVTMRTAGFSAPGGQAVRVTGSFAATPGR